MKGGLLLTSACLASGAAGVALGFFAKGRWARASIAAEGRAATGKGAGPASMSDRPAPGDSGAPEGGGLRVTHAIAQALQQAHDPAAPRELSDEELDAMPPDLPAPTPRSRRARAAPARPAFRRL